MREDVAALFVEREVVLSLEVGSKGFKLAEGSLVGKATYLKNCYSVWRREHKSFREEDSAETSVPAAAATATAADALETRLIEAGGRQSTLLSRLV